MQFTTGPDGKLYPTAKKTESGHAMRCAEQFLGPLVEVPTDHQRIAREVLSGLKRLLDALRPEWRKEVGAPAAPAKPDLAEL